MKLLLETSNFDITHIFISSTLLRPVCKISISGLSITTQIISGTFFHSRMFWTNWNDKQASIQTAYMSGSGVKAIISTDIKTPNGLAIDHPQQRLYWADARLDMIESCKYDGSQRTVSFGVFLVDRFYSFFLNLGPYVTALKAAEILRQRM